MEAETSELIKDLFADKKCCKCDRKAERLRKGRFYCPFHFHTRLTEEEVPRRVLKHPTLSNRKLM